MVSQKKYFKKTYKKKPTMKKAQAMVTKKKKQQKKSNLDTFSLKAVGSYLVHPTQGVAVSNYVYGGTNLLGTNLLNNADFNYYRLQYDKFRINSVKMRWIPKANVMSIADAQADSIYRLTGDGMIHTCIDRDNQAPSSQTAIQRYPSYKAFSILKKWVRNYAITYAKNVWLDCQNPTNPENNGIRNVLGLLGGIYYYAEDIIEDIGEIANEPLAQMIMEFNVVFQGKTSGTLSFEYDASGNVSASRITRIDEEQNKAFSAISNLKGFLQNTKLTNTVEDIDQINLTEVEELTDIAPP